MKKLSNYSGFTLIEVLVAIAIFSLIAVGTASAITRSLKVKKVVEDQWDEGHAIRTALTIMGRDIYLAFHKQTPADQPLGRWFQTFFKAEHDEMNFTSLAHRRLRENTHESELCEIGYKLVGKNLMRRISLYVNDDPDKGGASQVLLENVKAVEFRFYSKDGDRWNEEWDSDHPDFRDKFPEAVEIELTVLRKDEAQRTIAKVIIAYPNNQRATAR